MFVSGVGVPTFVPKVELGDSFHLGGLITFQVSQEGNFKPISKGVGELNFLFLKLSCLKKKGGAKFNIKNILFYFYVWLIIFLTYE